MLRLVFWGLLQSVLLPAVPSYVTFPSDIDWVTQESAHFQVIYRRGRDAVGLRVLGYAEDAYKKLIPYFPQAPERTYIVLADFNDTLNGYGIDTPYSHMVLFLAPPSAGGELAALDDWLPSVILHEFTHVLHLYPSSWLYRPMRSVFGSWVMPNAMLPTHFHEGLAVYFETKFSDGGRGRGPTFNMYRRMATLSGRWNLDSVPLDQLEASRVAWPMGANPYYYGYHLFDELAGRGGRENLLLLTDEFSGNWPYLHGVALNHVYKTDFDSLWTDIFKKTGERSRAEAEKIRSEGLSSLENITQTKYHKWNLVLSPDRKRFAYRKADPYDGSGLMIHEVATGKFLERLDLSAGPTDGICWGKSEGNDLFLFIKNVERSSYSLNTLSTTQGAVEGDKFSLKHVQALGCNRDLSKLILYQEEATEGVVREVTFRQKEKGYIAQSLREWKNPDGTWVTSALSDHRGSSYFLLRERMKTSLFRWGSSATPEKILTFPVHTFELKSDGKELFAIASLDGRDEIYSIDLIKKSASKRVALLGGTSAFLPVDGRFLLASYDHGGYDIAWAKPVERPPRTLKAENDRGAEREIAAVTQITAKDYSPWSTLYPRGWIPNVFVVPDGVQAAIWVPGFDISQRHLYNVFGGYDTRGLLFVDSSYVYRTPYSVDIDAGAHIMPNYLFSIKQIQKQWGTSLGISKTLFDDISLRVGAIFKRVESSALGIANQSVGSSVSASYRTGYKTRPLSTSPIKGTSLSISHSHYLQALGSTDNYFATTAGIENHLEIPWLRDHTIFTSLRGGYTQGNSLFNSYFASGGEYIISPGRSYFYNRGFLPDQFISRRILNLNLEYRFPIAQVHRGYEFLPLYLKSIHAALVTDVSTRDRGIAHPRDNFAPVRSRIFEVFFASQGIEFKTDWTLGYYLPAQLRLGIYHGYGPLGEPLYFTLGLDAALL